MRLIDRFATRALPDGTYTGASNAAVVLAQSYGSNDAERILPTFQSYAGEGYHANGIVFAVILRRLNLFCEAEFKFRDLTNKRLFGNPDLGILEEPWPNGTTGDLLARMEQDVSLAGNAFIVRDGNRLRRLRPDWVDIIRVKSVGYNGSDSSDVAGYLHWPEGRAVEKQEFFTVDEVAHWAPIPDPLAEWRGMSWLTPVVREINSDTSMTNYKRSFFDNNATPNALIKYQKVLEKGAWEQITTRWNARHGGPDGWKLGILDNGADFQVIGNTFEQMNFADVQLAGTERIAAAGGVPLILVAGSNPATYANYPTAMRDFADSTMRPNWRSAAGALAKLVKVPAGARLWFDTSDIAALREGERERAEIMQMHAATASTLLTAGYEATSITDAITAADVSLLKHTGLISVQLAKVAAKDAPAISSTDPIPTAAPNISPPSLPAA